ncbi:hypothetical protein ACFLU9_02995 [Chloroflexota bacterium]
MVRSCGDTTPNRSKVGHYAFAVCKVPGHLQKRREEQINLKYLNT